MQSTSAGDDAAVGFVADSSVGVSWVLPSQASPLTDWLLDSVKHGRTLHIPALWVFEIANALWLLNRRKKITQEDRDRARRALGQLSPVVDNEGFDLALTSISRVADEHSLTVYDATYLELALRRGVPLATRDTALNQAARRSNVETLL